MRLPDERNLDRVIDQLRRENAQDRTDIQRMWKNLRAVGITPEWLRYPDIPPGPTESSSTSSSSASDSSSVVAFCGCTDLPENLYLTLSYVSGDADAYLSAVAALSPITLTWNGFSRYDACVTVGSYPSSCPQYADTNDNLCAAEFFLLCNSGTPRLRFRAFLIPGCSGLTRTPYDETKSVDSCDPFMWSGNDFTLDNIDMASTQTWNIEITE